MTLSNKSMNNIAKAIVQEVVEELFESDEWMEFLHTNIGGIIVDKLGQIDDEVLAELIMCTADRIGLRSFD
jgi:hypothetical protein